MDLPVSMVTGREFLRSQDEGRQILRYIFFFQKAQQGLRQSRQLSPTQSPRLQFLRTGIYRLQEILPFRLITNEQFYFRVRDLGVSLEKAGPPEYKVLAACLQELVHAIDALEPYQLQDTGSVLQLVDKTPAPFLSHDLHAR